MDFNMNIKDNNLVVALLEGAGHNIRASYKRLEEAKSEDRMVKYYNMKHASNEAIYANLDHIWHKNHYASLKSYAGDDPISKAELAVDKAKLFAAKAKWDHAHAVYKEAEAEWMK